MKIAEREDANIQGSTMNYWICGNRLLYILHHDAIFTVWDFVDNVSSSWFVPDYSPDVATYDYVCCLAFFSNLFFEKKLLASLFIYFG